MGVDCREIAALIPSLTLYLLWYKIEDSMGSCAGKLQPSFPVFFWTFCGVRCMSAHTHFLKSLQLFLKVKPPLIWNYGNKQSMPPFLTGFLTWDRWLGETGVEEPIVGRWPTPALGFQMRHRLFQRVAGTAWVAALVLKWSGFYQSKKSTYPVCILSPVCSFCYAVSFFPGSHLHLWKLVHSFQQLLPLLLRIKHLIKIYLTAL